MAQTFLLYTDVSDKTRNVGVCSTGFKLWELDELASVNWRHARSSTFRSFRVCCRPDYRTRDRY